jgi:hypothetical protein
MYAGTCTIPHINRQEIQFFLFSKMDIYMFVTVTEKRMLLTIIVLKLYKDCTHFNEHVLSYEECEFRRETSYLKWSRLLKEKGIQLANMYYS